MSKRVASFARLALIACLLAAAPGTAEARHWRGHSYSWSFGFGFGYPYYGPYYRYRPYYRPYYYAPPPRCGWVRYRVWRRGHWAYRRAWRCW
jgi:hypothetical protein